MLTKTGDVIVTGIPSTDTRGPQTDNIPYQPGIPCRLEITKLFQASDTILKNQWTLFVLALETFKNLSVDDPLSYFQIAGIHGYPMTAWNSVAAPAKDAEDPATLHPGKDEFGGYCNHNSITFPTWHRAYLLLFEQCICRHMKEIVSSWALEGSESLKWHYAADTWRLPYWDWGRDSCFPEAITLDRVRIFPPACRSSLYQSPYPNPLRGFENPEKDENGRPLPFGSMPKGKEHWNIADNKNNKPVLPWSQCSGTSRYGLDRATEGKGLVGVEGRNNVASANKNMANCSSHWYSPYREDDIDRVWQPPSSFSDAIHRMFSPDQNATWGTFASTKWWRESEKNDAGYMSLEYIHNNVHNICGGDKFSMFGGDGVGHMADVPVAAFDPLFWLHHCNIDRLTAMWQCLNWQLWWDRPEPQHPRLVDGNVADPLSTDPLLPFRKQDRPAAFWTSDDVRDWTRLNYQYEDLAPRPGAVLSCGKLNEAKYQQDLRDLIDTTYRSTESLVRDILYDYNLDCKDSLGASEVDDTTWSDYVLDVVYDRYALDGSSYSIEFYLQDGFDQWSLGQIYSLGGLPMNSNGSCGNCRLQRSGNTLSRAQVPLTVPFILLMLDKHFKITGLDHENVIACLKGHLRCKFVQLGGREMPAERFPHTRILLRTSRKSLRPQDGDSRLRDGPSTIYEFSHMMIKGKINVERCRDIANCSQ